MKSKTIEFFKQIASIPRESGNEEQIAQYLCEFAKKRNLYYECDNYNNVLIKKKTCNKEPIILQAHTDMVCEKEISKSFCFKTQGIEIIEENGYLKANGTTLGADNGIGVAQILAILDSDILCNIEAVFTVSEETSMIGAMKFDTNKLEGKKLLSLDGFEENTIITESACFYDIVLKSSHCFKENESNLYKIELTGMPGGHSGFEIDKNCGNSSIELAKLLKQIQDIKLSSFIGGTKFNVIPANAQARFYTSMPIKQIQKICKQTQLKLQKQYPKIQIEVKKQEEEKKVLSKEQSAIFLQTIINFPHGVIHKNLRQEVTTSINLGAVDLEKQEMKVGMRSSKKEEEMSCINLIKKFSKESKLEFSILSSQPGFSSNQTSNLIQELIKAHPKEDFKVPVVIKAVHITVELGFFKEKIPELQIAIIAPNIQGAHTVRECVDVASIEKVDKWLLKFLST
ncbi:MAG: aminoacyl-histidine dipeptidase [Clostridia bacterium]|nr:aminoacyl-histidine dipeptidase [Clostridia bacterium]